MTRRKRRNFPSTTTENGEDVAYDVLKKAVEDQDYKVID